MVIDLVEYQCQQFHKIVQRLRDAPELYLHFDHIGDFYQANFLDEFPQGTTWSVLGLDDGGEYFDVVIRYRDCFMKLIQTETLHIQTSLDPV